MRPIFLEQFARIGKALSSPNRLALLDLLCQSEKTVETLVVQSNLTLKNTSAQLKVMKDAGLLKSRRDGKFIYYSLNDRQVSEFWTSLQSFASRHLCELQKITAKLIADGEGVSGVNREELMTGAKSGEVIVLDVRPVDEYESDHIPFAISVPLADLKKRMKELPKETEIVAYCRGPYCLLAVEAVRILRRSGYQAVRMEEGVQEWRSAELQISPISSEF
jgi:rhodanese-related sulfurtransferase/DNA-binding MarR family transcriptional regulator